MHGIFLFIKTEPEVPEGEDSGLSTVVVDCTEQEKSDCDGEKEENELVMEVEEEDEGESSAVEMVAASADMDSDSTTPTILTTSESPLPPRNDEMKPSAQPNRYPTIVHEYSDLSSSFLL